MVAAIACLGCGGPAGNGAEGSDGGAPPPADGAADGTFRLDGAFDAARPRDASRSDGGEAGARDGGEAGARDGGDAGRQEGGEPDGGAATRMERLVPGPADRHLVGERTGRPFFWLSDTAWGLFSLAPDDIRWYLRKRRDQGFTVISVGNVYPNYYRTDYAGNAPFVGDDITRPNEAFFAHLDFILDEAEALGLYVSIRGLGHAIDAAVRDYYPDEVMHLSPSQAADFCAWLGRRWRGRPNLIFSGGQDKPALRRDLSRRSPPDQRPYWRAQGEGWVRGVTGATLRYDEASPMWWRITMTWHPPGSQGSAQYFHRDGWLTFNQLQSWNFDELYSSIERDVALSPPKPVFYGETVYEGDRRGSGAADGTVARDVRAQAYVSVFAGGFGYTYGAAGVYFFDGRGGRSWRRLVEENPAGRTLRHLRSLIESRPMLERRGGSGLVRRPGSGVRGRVQGALSQTGSYAFVYFPRANMSKVVRVGLVSGARVDAWWFDPRTGTTHAQDGSPSSSPFATFDSDERFEQRFDPPGDDPDEDWVLVLDDRSRGFGPPGASP